MKSPRVGVIGGSGYLGSSLAESLSRKFEVRVLDKTTCMRKPHSGNVEHQFCNILRCEELKQGLDEVDVAIHAAIVQIPLINEQKQLGYEVNVLGTQNVCRIASETPSLKGLILAGTWHVFGEKELEGKIDEEFGFRPDKVEERAYLYALSKTAQETIVRFYDQMSSKTYGIVRLGTVLGEGMPEQTAANIFISKGLKEEPITPYKHSMHRPMLYVDIHDVCQIFEAFIERILSGKIQKNKHGASNIVNLCWPHPITIIQLARIVEEEITRLSEGRIKPKIEIVDTGRPILHAPEDFKNVQVDVTKLKSFLGQRELKNPRDSIRSIIQARLERFNARS